MTMLALCWKQEFGTEFSEESEEIRQLVIVVWNMALQAMNRQAILLTYNEVI